MENQDEICCPKCCSNQITANQKGFSGGKAIGGAILTGGIGLLAGLHGSKKIVITCLACGHKFKAGEGKTRAKFEQDKLEKEKRIEEIKNNPPSKESQQGCAIMAILFIVGLVIFLLTR